MSINCLLVGDQVIGKRSFLQSVKTFNNARPNSSRSNPFEISTSISPSKVLAPFLEEYREQVEILPNVNFHLSTMTGEEEFSEVRNLSYKEADIFILAFSIVNRSSFVNLEKKWFNELEEFNKKIPIILVGLKYDLRNDLETQERLKEPMVSESEGIELSWKLGAKAYVECSSISGKGIDCVLSAIMREHLNKLKKKDNKNCVIL